MNYLNRLYLLLFSVLCLGLAGCEGGYGSWGGEPAQSAQDVPQSLSDAQVANGAGDVYLTPGAQTPTAQSLQETPLRDQPASAAPVPAPTAAPIKVAILLPLSGKDSALGAAMLQAAQMALFDIGQNAFELLPRDTATGARAAAQGAIAEGAQLILGPVFAADVREAKPVAMASNVNMIAFSTDWTLAGGNTFIMGFMPFDQLSRVLSYAQSKGMRHIGAVATGGQYANAVISHFRSKMGPSLLPTDVLTVPANPSDLPVAMQAFARQATVPFDAVLLPAGGSSAIALSESLNQNGMPPARVRRIGTGLWEDESLARSPALDGGLFAAPAPDQRAKFESRYRELYASAPPRLASLAYDATALATVLARGSDKFSRASIINPNGFTGVDGIFRFRGDGLAERGLAVLEFRGGKINVVDPAPRSFLNPR